MTKEQLYEKFMRDSNAIEGEFENFPMSAYGPIFRSGSLHPNDIEAVKYAIKSKGRDIEGIHVIVGQYLNEEWVGRWRLCNVRVGSYRAPDWRQIPDLMKEYWEKFPSLKSWEAHNEFEKIHPFQDLNGRVGRILWLVKALKEGYNFSIPFLQSYYYQTLDRFEKK